MKTIMSFFFSSRRRHTRCSRDWSSDVCSSDLRESRRIVRMDQGVLITETHHGWVCANAGVDQSNVDVECVALLPEDPDGSARALRDRIRARSEEHHV